MNEHWTDRLSEYLDNELDADERSALEAHLATCASCRVTLDELGRVLKQAEALEDREPARDLWPRILRTLTAGDDGEILPFRAAPGAPRRFTFSMPQLAAAAVLLMAISGGSVWLLSQRRHAAPAVAAADSLPLPDSPAASAARFVSETQKSYGGTIQQLQQELQARRSQLDSATIAVVERNLDIIDRAIADARSALQNDPSNAYLYRHLDDTLMKKIELLRRVTSLRAEI